MSFMSCVINTIIFFFKVSLNSVSCALIKKSTNTHSDYIYKKQFFRSIE